MEIIIAIILFVIAIIVAEIYIKKVQANKKVNTILLEHIPSAFPSLGIILTLTGIVIGLWNFDTANIQKSIPDLLNGLKFAFLASMFGIVCLLVYQRRIAIITKKLEEDPNKPPKQSNELEALNVLIVEHKKGNDEFKKIAEALNVLIVEYKKGNDEFKKIAEALNSQNNELIEQRKREKQEYIETKQLSQTFRADVLKQIEALQEGQKKSEKVQIEAQQYLEKVISKQLQESRQLLATKFNEFSELLKKSNTESLVQVMKAATEEFNKQMSDLVGKLVQENFQELNNSVLRMNEWQIQNKEQIATLTAQFRDVSEKLKVTTDTIQQITQNTEQLTSENGKLAIIVKELNQVIVDEKKFTEHTNNLVNASKTLEKMLIEFDETSNRLNQWIKTQYNFKNEVQLLIEQIKKFQDFNSGVWQDYRKEMGNAVNIISDSSKKLNIDLRNINAEFYNRLNSTLENLDECIQRVIEKANKSR